MCVCRSGPGEVASSNISCRSQACQGLGVTRTIVKKISSGFCSVFVPPIGLKRDPIHLKVTRNYGNLTKCQILLITSLLEFVVKRNVFDGRYERYGYFVQFLNKLTTFLDCQLNELRKAFTMRFYQKNSFILSANIVLRISARVIFTRVMNTLFRIFSIFLGVV